MRVAHFDCFSGISGDMTLGALVAVGVPQEAIKDAIASLGLPITLEFERIRKGGFAAIHARVEAPDQEEYRFLKDVEEILDRSKLSPGQRELAHRIFRRLAEAEAAVHGHSVDRVHFHEVGALDSITDILGAAVGLDLLGVEQFSARSVPTGFGTVKTAHGIMPIPTPATAELLKGVPLAPSKIEFELTTPTGAAILTSVVSTYRDHPLMRIEKIGYGAGTKEFLDQPNVLRLFVGEAETETAAERDRVWQVETNLDDVPAEIVGYCYDLLFAAGALDVFTIPIHMKKNRSGMLFSVLVGEPNVEAVEEILFRETGTLGIRRVQAERSKRQRKNLEVMTQWGPVLGKLGWRSGDEPVFTPEFEACARIARERGVALARVYDEARQAYRRQG
jgi:uncharacterized protein (TIGR00299 family) protein